MRLGIGRLLPNDIGTTPPAKGNGIEMRARQITHEEIDRAFETFQEEGGFVQHLADEIVTPNRLVGAKWGCYEEIMPFSREDPPVLNWRSVALTHSTRVTQVQGSGYKISSG